MSIFPIIHDHKEDVVAAERHCWALVQGGWSAKVKRPAGKGWQVIINGYHGFIKREAYGQGAVQANRC